MVDGGTQIPPPERGSGSLLQDARRDAEKWRDLAAADGGATDPAAERTLALLAEIDRLTLANRRSKAEAQELLRVLTIAPQPDQNTWEWRHRYVNDWLPLLRETLAQYGAME
jgi:hypothetical protein